MSSKEHTAIGIEKENGPLSSFTLPTPSPKTNEILIRVLYVGLTPGSQWQVDFGLLVYGWPLVLGGTIVGTVVEIGEGVEGIEKGERVNMSIAARKTALTLER